MTEDYKVLYSRCRFQEALASCKATLSVSSKDEEALWIGALSLRELGEMREAIRWFRNLLTVNPTRIGAELYANVLGHLVDGKSDEPFVVHAGGHQVSVPQGANAMLANDYNEMGLSLAEEGRFKDSIEWYDRALRLRPEHAIAWYNKGIALARAQQFRNAVDCFDEALALEPSYVDALYSKAGCAFELKQFGLARDCCEEVLAINPRDHEARQLKEESARRLRE